MKHSIKLALALLVGSALLLALAATAVLAQGPRGGQPKTVTGALGNGFTYQGQLKQGTNPVNGTCSISFGLWDAATLGSQVGVTLTQSIAVANGLFTSQPLDFGSTAFDGNARFLQIAAKCGSESAYSTLTPRQTLTAAPYALFAKRFSGYQNIKVVAKSGGDYTSVADALNSILDAGPTNPYLVYVAPGVYTETVTMKSYVDIEGAGELATKIIYPGSSSGDAGTVVGADNAELRFLTVENTGGATSAIAINNYTTSPRLSHVTAIASGGSYSSVAVNNYFSSPSLTDVSATASGVQYSYGVYNWHSPSPTMMNVTATAYGPGQNSGVANNTSSPTMVNVTASASGGTSNAGIVSNGSSLTMTGVSASGSGGTSSYGLNSVYASSATMVHVTLTASGAAQNYGLRNEWSSATIQDGIVSASGGTSYGIYNTAPSSTYTVTVNSSQITGGNNTIYNDPHFVVRVGGSELSGGAVSGSVTCIGAWDENYTSPGYTTCP